MPLFGGKREAEDEKLRAELDRISALSLQQLATEVMVKGFGPGGAADGCFAEPGAIAGAFNPAEGSYYGATRYGKAALAQNAVEHVLSGGSLETTAAPGS